jgi:Arc/MetJ-type ribon-helix-helix transcriptional regulator
MTAPRTRERLGENIRVRVSERQRLALIESLLERGLPSEGAAIREAVELWLAQRTPKEAS